MISSLIRRKFHSKRPAFRSDNFPAPPRHPTDPMANVFFPPTSSNLNGLTTDQTSPCRNVVFNPPIPLSPRVKITEGPLYLKFHTHTRQGNSCAVPRLDTLAAINGNFPGERVNGLTIRPDSSKNPPQVTSFYVNDVPSC